MSLDLTTDCTACVGLCCKTFQFETGPDFAIEKSAGQSCPHLGSDFSCTIHADRVAKGFSGCLIFDCQGAGQRIVHEVYAGFDWPAAGALLPEMIDAFRVLREVHRLYELIDISGALPLSDDHAAERRDLLSQLGVQPINASWLAEFEQSALPQRATKYLKSLTVLVPHP